MGADAGQSRSIGLETSTVSRIDGRAAIATRIVTPLSTPKTDAVYPE